MNKVEQPSARRRGSGDTDGPELSYVVLGQVRRPHGVGGEVRVEIITDYPERVAQHDDLYLAPPGRPDHLKRCQVESVRPHKGVLLIKLAGYDDREAANELRGMLVQLPLEEAVPLEEEEYYYFQLEGMEVKTETGECLGRVIEVLEPGAHDVYLVQGPRGEILIPAIEDVILELDLEAGKMLVRPLPGMLEDEET